MWNINIKKILIGMIGVCTLLVGCGSGGEEVDKELAYRQVGINHMNQGNYQEALHAFQNALGQSNGKIQDLELDICYYKAEAQIKSKDEKGALSTYNAVVEYDKKNTGTYYLRGCLYLDMGKEEKALKDYEQAASLETNNYQLFRGIFQSLISNGKEEEGRRFLKQALEIKGEKAENFRERGHIFYLLGDYDEAGRNLDKAQNMGDEQAKLYMAQLLEATGDSKGARAIYENYAKTHAKDGRAQEKLGNILMEQKEYEGAAESLTKALEAGTAADEQGLRKKIIVCSEKLGDFQTAKTQLEEYLEQYPKDQTAIREYDFLKSR